MARQKQAIKIIRDFISKIEYREQDGIIQGMIIMAYMLNNITFDERETLEAELEEKYWTLEN